MPSLVRYACFHGPLRPLELTTCPLPAIGPGEALVCVECTTLGPSDVRTFTGQRLVQAPVVLGAEVVGRIVNVYPAAPPIDVHCQPLGVGDRIAILAATPCGECRSCRRGQGELCLHPFTFGRERATTDRPLCGGLCEYAHVLARQPLVRVANALPDALAALVGGAMAWAVGALAIAGDVSGRVVLVAGLGARGLLACAAARLRGASAVIAADHRIGRLAQALEFGATHTAWQDGSDAASRLAKIVQQASAGQGVDVLLEFSEQVDQVTAEMATLGPGATAVLAGRVSPYATSQLRVDELVRGGIAVAGMAAPRHADLVAAAALAAVLHTQFPWGQLIEQSFTLGDAQLALEFARDHLPLRVVVRM